ncbi:MAG: S24 family peptidase [Pseudomonadota bacterium]
MLGWRLTRIDGDSMTPDISPGSYAIFRRRPYYTPGDTVLCDHSVYGRITKRIVSTEPDGFRLAGTNPKSVSTEAMGVLEAHRVLGKLTMVFSPPKTRAASITELE